MVTAARTPQIPGCGCLPCESWGGSVTLYVWCVCGVAFEATCEGNGQYQPLTSACGLSPLFPPHTNRVFASCPLVLPPQPLLTCPAALGEGFPQDGLFWVQPFHKSGKRKEGFCAGSRVLLAQGLGPPSSGTGGGLEGVHCRPVLWGKRLRTCCRCRQRPLLGARRG